MYKLWLSAVLPSLSVTDARKKSKPLVEVPGFDQAKVNCAACEVVAREIEDKMKLGKHKPDEVARLDVLMSSCDQMDYAFPSKLEGVGELPVDTVQFWKNTQEKEKTMPGMREFCTDLMEHHEEGLSEALKEAVPTVSPLTATGKHRGSYEMKVAICVQTTKSCTEDDLNLISHNRIGMVKDPQKMLAEMLGVSKADLRKEALSREAIAKPDAEGDTEAAPLPAAPTQESTGEGPTSRRWLTVIGVVIGGAIVLSR